MKCQAPDEQLQHGGRPHRGAGRRSHRSSIDCQPLSVGGAAVNPSAIRAFSATDSFEQRGAV